MEIKITTPQVEDAEGMQDVFYYAWLATYPNEEYGVTRDDVEDRFKDRHDEARLEKRREALRAPGPNQKIFVAKDGSKVVGLCRAVISGERNEIGAIYIVPEYQGKGIGTMLWNEAKTFFDPTKDTFVKVVTYNTKAIAFYTKLGFVDTGNRFADERFRLKSGAIMPEMEMVIRSKK